MMRKILAGVLVMVLVCPQAGWALAPVSQVDEIARYFEYLSWGEGDEKAPGSEALKDGGKDGGYFRGLMDGAGIAKNAGKYIKKALEVIKDSEAPRKRKINMSDIVIHTVLADYDGKPLLGIPRFSGAHSPKDLIYTHGVWDGKKLHIYITEGRWKRVEKERIRGRYINWLAQSIDHEWAEHVELKKKDPKRHHKASERARYFAGEGQLSPFHFIYLDELFSYLKENPSLDIFKWVYDKLLFTNRTGIKSSGVRSYEKLFMEVAIIKSQKLLRPRDKGGLYIKDKKLEMRIRQGIWEAILRYPTGKRKCDVVIAETGRHINHTDIAKNAHVLLYGKMVGDALYLGKRWGEFKFARCKGSDYILEIKYGVPERIFFKKDNTSYQFLKVINNQTKKVIDICTLQVPYAKLSRYKDVIIESYLGREGDLKMGGGKPDIFGETVREVTWAQCITAPNEKVRVVVKDGIVHRCISLESDLDAEFALVKHRGKIVTSFYGSLNGTEYNSMTSEHEIYNLGLGESKGIRTGGKPQKIYFKSLQGRGGRVRFYDLHHIGDGYLVGAAEVTEIVNSKEDVLASKVLSLIYEVKEVEDNFDKGRLAGVLESFNKSIIERIFGRGDTDFIATRVRLNRQFLHLGGSPKEFNWFPNAEVEVRFVRGKPRYVKFIKNENGFPILDKELNPLIVDLSTDKSTRKQIEERYYGGRYVDCEETLTEGFCYGDIKLKLLRVYFPDAKVLIRRYTDNGAMARYVKLTKDGKGRDILNKYRGPVVVNLQEDIEPQMKEAGFNNIDGEDKKTAIVRDNVVPDYRELKDIGEVDSNFYKKCLKYINGKIGREYIENLMKREVNNVPIEIKIVESTAKVVLGHNSARYYVDGKIVVVFDENFIKLLMKYKDDKRYSRAVKWIFMERYLHELSHDNLIKGLKEEQEEEVWVIMENDLPLYERYVYNDREGLGREIDGFWKNLTSEERTVIMRSRQFYKMLRNAVSFRTTWERRGYVRQYVRKILTKTGKGKRFPVADGAEEALRAA